jgi:hypothetical protein
LFESQGRCCAICKKNDPASKKGWHTGHDHSTGFIRGILCHDCNVMLGYAQDSLEVLQKAIEYLSFSQKFPEIVSVEF